MRDFNYLSNILSKYDMTKKSLSAIDSSVNKQQELVRYKILAEHALTKGVVLRFAPKVIERHRNNISFFFTKEKIIYWVIETILVIRTNPTESRPEYSSIKHISAPVSEKGAISTALTDFPFNDNRVLEYLGGERRGSSSWAEAGLELWMENRYDLERVKKDSEVDLQVSFQVLEEHNKMVKVDPQSPIERVLRDLELVEFPTLYLLKKEEVQAFILQAKLN